MLSLYLLCIDTFHEHELTELNADLILMFRALEKGLYDRLEPSPSIKIDCCREVCQSTIKENVYIGIGFDIEFTQADMEINTMVSAQLAVNTRTYIQIPFSQPYVLSSRDCKNKVIALSKTSSALNYRKIETSLQLTISKLSELKYAGV